MDAVDTGEQRLKELGYKQELKRDLSVFTNFAFSFNIISILTGVTTLFTVALNYGGPAVSVYGWIMVSIFSSIVAFSMAEVCSAYPTSGGLYYWSAMLAGPKWGPFASWVTGWFNAVGQWAVTASVNFSLAQWIGTTILLSTGTATGGGYYPSKGGIIGIYAGILVIQGALNSCPISVVAWLETVSVAWNIIGSLVIIIVLPSVATHTQSAKYVFATYTPDDGTGIHSEPYLFLLGLLFAQYTITGFDASAHMTEETKSADQSGAQGIYTSVLASAVVGFGYILSLLFSIPDPAYVVSADNESAGYSAAQIFWQVFYERYGSGTGGIVLMQIITVSIFFCGTSCLAACSRMNYAFSRDNAMPGSFLWKRAHPTTGVPIPAVWLATTVAFCMGLPYLGSTVAFTAMTSIAVIGLYLSYGLPIFLRLTVGRATFPRGPFHLGILSDAFAIISCCWIITITVLFCLPTAYPITSTNFQYSPVAVGCCLVFVLGGWFLSARWWFKGPIRNIDVEDVQKAHKVDGTEADYEKATAFLA